jgi:hypothetical protein
VLRAVETLELYDAIHFFSIVHGTLVINVTDSCEGWRCKLQLDVK